MNILYMVSIDTKTEEKICLMKQSHELKVS